MKTDQLAPGISKTSQIRIRSTDNRTELLPTGVDEVIKFDTGQIRKVLLWIPGHKQLQPLQAQGIRNSDAARDSTIRSRRDSWLTIRGWAIPGQVGSWGNAVPNSFSIRRGHAAPCSTDDGRSRLADSNLSVVELSASDICANDREGIEGIQTLVDMGNNTVSDPIQPIAS